MSILSQNLARTTLGSDAWLRAAEAHLRAQGHRLTTGRHLILTVLAEADRHLSAADIRAIIVERGVRLDLATTYRTLRSLEAAELAHVLSLSSDAGSLNLFGRTGLPHQHAACTVCGVLRDVAPMSNPEQLAELAARAGVIEHPSLLIVGTCLGCATTRAPIDTATRNQ